MQRILTSHARDDKWFRRAASTRELLVPGTYKPGASTTGALQATLPALNASNTQTLIITQDNTVLQNLTIFGDVHIQAKNVVIKQCILRGGNFIPSSNSGIVNCNSAKCFNAVIEDCTIHPQRASWYRDGIVGHEYTARRNHIWNTNDGLGAFITNAIGTDTNVLLEANYVHDLTYWYPEPAHTDGTHNDCVQIQGGANVHVIGNYFHGSAVMGEGSQNNPLKPRLLNETPKHINGSGTIIQKQSVTAPLKNVVVEKNWYKGGVCGVNLKPGTYTVRDNIFARGGFYDYNGDNPGRQASAFPIRGDNNTNTFVSGLYTNNRWEDNNALLKGAANGGTRFDGIRWDNVPD